MKFKHLIYAPCAALLVPALSTAQPAVSSGDRERSGTFSTIFDGSFTAAGDLELDGVKSGELETGAFHWNGTYEQPFGEAWSFSVGVDYEHLSLEHDLAVSPLPESLEGIALELGARWRYNDRWIFSAQVAPGFYGDGEIDSGDAFTVPARLLATWIQSETLIVTFGARINPFSDSEVMPIVNVRWAVNPDWMIVLGLPRTEARYQLSERLTVFGGVAAFGGSYAVDDPAVVAPPGKSLRDTKVSVSEFRALVGIDYEFTPNMKLSLEGGYAFTREIDYHERDVEYEADAAATVGLSLNVSF